MKLAGKLFPFVHINPHDPSSRYTIERDKLNLSEETVQSNTLEAQTQLRPPTA